MKIAVVCNTARDFRDFVYRINTPIDKLRLKVSIDNIELIPIIRPEDARGWRWDGVIPIKGCDPELLKLVRTRLR